MLKERTLYIDRNQREERKLSFSPCLKMFSYALHLRVVNPLPHMPILGSSNSKAEKRGSKNMDK